MSIIKAYRLYKSYGSLAVLSDVSFSLEREQKVALIGRNGTGKTTLLKIIAGFEAQDSGKIEIPAGTCVGYLPQDTSLSEDKPIMDYLRNKSGISALENELEELSVDLGDPTKAKRYIEVHTRFKYLDGYSFTHRAEIILAGFGLDGVKLDQSLLNLSSGQKTKVVLAGILLKRADLLLLDEPTNNLDLPALIWLEDFLRKSNASCIIVSHDRKFLDRVADKIFKLDWRTCSLAITKGTYTDYLKMMAKHAASQRGKYRIQQEEINRLNERAREKRADAIRGSRWTGRDNDKFLKGFKRDQAAKSSKIAKSIKKRIEQMNKIEKPVDKKSLKVLLNARVNSGILDVEVSNVVTGYPGSFLIGPLSLEIRYGSRVGIVGLNGAGKSTLLKTITGEIEPLNGTVRIGSGIKIGNMMQEHEILPRGQILIEFLSERSGLSYQDSYSKLSKFGFDERQVELSINTLSPGSRARLLLALFSAQSVNMLVLDEPTNHLDIEALEALEEAIRNYQGTMLLVSHDRHFLEKISVDVTYILSDGLLTKISDYKVYIKTAEERARKLLNLL